MPEIHGNTRDLVGKQFGRLTVIEFAGYKKRTNTTGGYPHWLCECICGNKKIIVTGSLLYGHTKSCGCLRIEYMMGKHRDNAKGYGESAMNSIYGVYKKRARQLGRSFDLTKEEALRLFKQSCFYCGQLPSNISRPHSDITGIFIYNGIDRIDNSKGYSIENCVPCCKTCNRAKNTFSIAEFDNWVKKVYNHRFGKAEDMASYQ